MTMTEPSDDRVAARIATFQDMTKKFPDQPLPWFSLGQTLVDAGRNEEAVPPLRRLLELDPDHGVGHLTLALALRALGRKEEARQRLLIGYEVARKRGEIIPARKMKNQLLSLCTEMGLDPPELNPLGPQKP